MPSESELLTAAEQRRQAGQREGAISLCQQVLESNPRHAGALALLGAVYTDLGHLDAATAHLDRALAIDPSKGSAHDSRGILFARQGRLAEAAACFEQAIACDPTRLVSLFNLATARFQSGDTTGAIEALKLVLRVEPSSLRAHAALATALAKENRLADAIIHLDEVARQKPGDSAARFDLACALLGAGQVDAAEAGYRKSLALNPNSPDCCQRLAEVLIERSEYAEAARLCERAIQLRPDDSRTHFSHGRVRMKLEHFALAAESFAEAARLRPEMAEAHVSLGITLAKLWQFDKAEASLRKALGLKSVDVEALHNLGLVLMQQNKLPDALTCIDQSLALAPNNAEGLHCRGMILLSMGKFSPGWAGYEHRVRCAKFRAPKFSQPLWDGSPLGQRTLLVNCEQGLGDTLQFARYLNGFFQPQDSVVVAVQPPLLPILAQSGFRGLVPIADELPHFDIYIQLLSLARIFRTELQSVPCNVPYIVAEAGRVARWRDSLAGLQGMKVGIAWKGRQIVWQGSGQDPRSIPLRTFGRVASLPGVQLLSLQKGDGSEQVAELAGQFDLVDLGPSLDNQGGAFLDTAAVMMNLDLVITSDTSIAHLAGALGVPVWVALCTTADWRWLLDRVDSPWYPTMRLFRQTRLGQWEDVFERIAKELDRLLVSRPAHPEKPR